jgi:hypothetical protein
LFCLFVYIICSYYLFILGCPFALVGCFVCLFVFFCCFLVFYVCFLLFCLLDFAYHFFYFTACLFFSDCFRIGFKYPNLRLGLNVSSTTAPTPGCAFFSRQYPHHVGVLKQHMLTKNGRGVEVQEFLFFHFSFFFFFLLNFLFIFLLFIGTHFGFGFLKIFLL